MPTVEIRFFMPRRFVVAVPRITRPALRFVVARLAKSLRLARRLDASERAAEFFNLAFVGEFLAFGDFDEFEHFVEMVRHLLEGVGNFRGVFDGLADGRCVGGSEIRILRPRRSEFRCRRALGAFGTGLALQALGAIRSFGPLRHESLRCGPIRFRAFNAFVWLLASDCRRWRWRGHSVTGHFGRNRFGRDCRRGCRWRNFRSGILRRSVGNGRTRSAGAAAPATAPAPAAAIGTTVASGGRRVQIGCFVWD